MCVPCFNNNLLPPSLAGRDGFDVRSDVWSLGISVIELATGKFPYPPWESVFDQLASVVEGLPPALPDTDLYTPNFKDFILQCLIKDVDLRPKYKALIAHPFFVENDQSSVDIQTWCSNIISQAIDMKFKL